MRSQTWQEWTTYIKTTALKLLKAAQMWELRQASVVLVVFLICIEIVSKFRRRVQRWGQTQNSGIAAKLLWTLPSCGLEPPAQHYSLGLLIGMALKHRFRGHVWETGERHPSRPDEDVHRKHVVNLGFSMSAVICSHNMHRPPSKLSYFCYIENVVMKVLFFRGQTFSEVVHKCAMDI